jgi:NADP-dependent 3-hydroxy acid dehydrogenase YdfG
MSPLTGRTVAITGAARAIGAAIAAEVVGRRGRVLLGDLDAGAVAQVAAGLGPAALSGPLDVTDDASYTAWLALADVDALVSNAGVMWVGAYDEEPESAGRRMMDVNFWGVVRGARLVLPGMRARRRGHLVTVASLASYIGPRGEATYGATKHAVHGWTKAVRAELAGSGVDFSLVMPAVAETELGRRNLLGRHPAADARTGRGGSRRRAGEAAVRGVRAAADRRAGAAVRAAAAGGAGPDVRRAGARPGAAGRPHGAHGVRAPAGALTGWAHGR